MDKIKTIILILVMLMIAGNLGYLDYQLIIENTERIQKSDNAGIVDNNKKEGADDCGLVCQQVIADKVASEVAKLTEEWEAKLVIPSPKAITQSSTININEPKVVIVPILSYGETTSVNWVEVKPSEFYFDLTNYPGAKEVSFEAYLLAEHGGSKIYARVYDATNYRGVDNSDIQTNSGSYVRVESSKMSIWRGNNKYIVQLKSENGTLAKIKDAKIVISY